MENLMRFDVTNERNLTMLVDFYELSMANGYFNKGVEERKARTRDIIVITFTKAAAENMKNRYKNTFNKTVSPFFGTFHGLF